jgi:flagellar basal body rod protein FlgG
VTANNVANASTPGFRGDALLFREVLGKAGKAPGGATRYCRVDRVASNTSRGSMVQTGRPLDVAIRNEGYLVIDGPQGERYARYGKMQVRNDGVLADGEGRAVFGTDRRPIRVPEESRGNARVGEDGTVYAGADAVGQVLVVRFEDEGRLEKDGPMMYRAGRGAGAPETMGASLAVGMLEGSNVTAVKGMTDLITVSRAFEACERAIDSYVKMDARGPSTIITPRG